MIPLLCVSSVGSAPSRVRSSLMTVFEHSFTLIGLVLGLALADVLGGLVRIARARGLNSIGLLIPMIAIFIVADITTFWGILWDLRGSMPNSAWPVLGFGILCGSIYYCAATLALPNDLQNWPDLDAYYMKYRRPVLGAMLLCYLIVFTLRVVMTGALTSDPTAYAYMIALALTLLAPGKVTNIVGLAVLIAVDIWAFFPLPGANT